MTSPLFRSIPVSDYLDSRQALSDRADGWRKMVAEQKRLRDEAFDRAQRKTEYRLAVVVACAVGLGLLALVAVLGAVWP